MSTFRLLFRHTMTLTTPLAALAMSSTTSAASPFEIPKECAKPGAATCAPDTQVIKRLCQRKSQDAALRMFKPGTPWKRLYIRDNIETRKALLKSKGITWRAGIRKNVCKSYGKRSLECEGARLDLARVGAERRHKGQAIPVLKFIP